MNVIMISVVRMSGIMTSATMMPNDNMLSDIMPIYGVWLCCLSSILLNVVMICVVAP